MRSRRILLAAFISLVGIGVGATATRAADGDRRDNQRDQAVYNSLISGVQGLAPANNNLPGPSPARVETNPGSTRYRPGWNPAGVPWIMAGAGLGALTNYALNQIGATPGQIAVANMMVGAFVASPAGLLASGVAFAATAANGIASDWIENHVGSLGGKILLNGTASGVIAAASAAVFAGTTAFVGSLATGGSTLGLAGALAAGLAAIPAATTLAAIGATVGVTAGLIYAGSKAIDYINSPDGPYKQPPFPGLGPGDSGAGIGQKTAGPLQGTVDSGLPGAPAGGPTGDRPWRPGSIVVVDQTGLPVSPPTVPPPEWARQGSGSKDPPTLSVDRTRTATAPGDPPPVNVDPPYLPPTTDAPNNPPPTSLPPGPQLGPPPNPFATPNPPPVYGPGNPPPPRSGRAGGPQDGPGDGLPPPDLVPPAGWLLGAIGPAITELGRALGQDGAGPGGPTGPARPGTPGQQGGAPPTKLANAPPTNQPTPPPTNNASDSICPDPGYGLWDCSDSEMAVRGCATAENLTKRLSLPFTSCLASLKVLGPNALWTHVAKPSGNIHPDILSVQPIAPRPTPRPTPRPAPLPQVALLPPPAVAPTPHMPAALPPIAMLPPPMIHPAPPPKPAALPPITMLPPPMIHPAPPPKPAALPPITMLPPPVVHPAPPPKPAALPPVTLLVPPTIAAPLHQPPAITEKPEEPQAQIPSPGAAEVHEPKVLAGAPKVHEPKVVVTSRVDEPRPRTGGNAGGHRPAPRPRIYVNRYNPGPQDNGTAIAIGAIGGAILQGILNHHHSGGGGTPQGHHQ
jgi:hypothetical protein